MTEDVKTQTEEEYHFAETEQTVDPSTVFSEEDTKQAATTKPIKKYVLIGAGVGVVLLVAGNFLSGFFSASSKDEVVEPEQVAVVAPVEAPQLVAPVAEVNQITQQTGDLDRRVADLLQKTEHDDMQIKGLQQGVAGLYDRLDSLEAQLANLDTHLSTVSNELLRQKTQLTRLQAAPKKAATVAKSKDLVEEKEREIYYIQAVVPGRAWLKTENGSKTLTVREGSEVDGYGMVRSIDVNEGSITMDTGELIKYSQNDN
ncbi:MAG: hypothetical protein V3V61_06755 [Gammaproteobacteria bacterium]